VGEPVQVPGLAVSVCPCCAAPVTVGRAELTGGLEADATTAVAAEDASTLPEVFEAVTNDRIVDPTSVALSRYVDPASPRISEQLAPPASHRCH
jgi:hypothetical protein